MPLALSTDLLNPGAIPYFLWDEPMTVAALRERLRTASSPEATRLLGKILREARNTDVWPFPPNSNSSRMLKNPILPRLLKKVQVPGGARRAE